MWLTMTMMEINTNKLFFIEKIAKPAEPVNGCLLYTSAKASSIAKDITVALLREIKKSW